MRAKAIYPGTFDPITNGHIDLVCRAARFFDEIILAVAASTAKQPFFPLDERLALAREALEGVRGVRVCQFTGLLVHFAKAEGVDVMLRGLRAVSDFEHEIQLADMNRRLSPGIETMFLTPGEGFGCISSSLVREIAILGGDVSSFVHPAVKAALDKRLG